MASKIALAVFLLDVAGIIAQWTTLSSIPSFNSGGAASFGSTVFVAVGTSAYTLDSLSGIWTTVASRPISSSFAVVGALSGQRAIVAGGPGYQATVHVFDMQTGTWTVKANLPIGVAFSAAGCDGERFWVAAGSELQEYDSDADVWTSKASLPFTTAWVSGAYWYGTFIVVGNDWIQVYAVALDSWTTGASLPSSRGNLCGGVAVIAGFGFVVGGYPGTGNAQKLERYDIGNDEWTTLDPVPKQSSRTVTAITSAGLLVAIGHLEGGTYVCSSHGFTTGFSFGSMIGDPVLSAFDGSSRRLDLYAGAFNLLTAPSVLVSALVEALPSLPPDENSVMTVVAIAGELRLNTFSIYCSVHNASMICQTTIFGQELPMWDFYSVDSEKRTFTVTLPEFTITVALSSVSSYPAPITCWLDVVVYTRAHLPMCRGLLCSTPTVGIEEYEIASGCPLEMRPAAMAPVSRHIFRPSFRRRDVC